MDVYEYCLESKKISLKGLDRKKACFLDIETTGLNRQHSYIYLIGLLYFNKEKNSWYLRQFFAHHIKNEERLLKEFNSFIKNFDLILSYNGDSFDIPFIEARFKKYGICSNLAEVESLDLYKKIKAESPYLDIENLKLKTIEEFVGIYREDEYSGKDCIEFYNQYIRNGDEGLKEKILQHNFDDLYYLGDIIKIFNHIADVKKLAIPLDRKEIGIRIEDIKINGDIIKICCNITNLDENVDIIHYDNGFNVNWQSNSMVIDIEVKEGLITPTRKALFIDKLSFPSKIVELRDLSEYVVPDNVILLKVENKYIMENIKNIIRELILYVK